MLYVSAVNEMASPNILHAECNRHRMSFSEFVISSYFIRYSGMETLLPAVRSGVLIPAGIHFSHLQNLQTGTAAHTASY